jgi:hypothetical protein
MYNLKCYQMELTGRQDACDNIKMYFYLTRLGRVYTLCAKHAWQGSDPRKKAGVKEISEEEAVV